MTIEFKVGDCFTDRTTGYSVKIVEGPKDDRWLLSWSNFPGAMSWDEKSMHERLTAWEPKRGMLCEGETEAGVTVRGVFDHGGGPCWLTANGEDKAVVRATLRPVFPEEVTEPKAGELWHGLGITTGHPYEGTFRSFDTDGERAWLERSSRREDIVAVSRTSLRMGGLPKTLSPVETAPTTSEPTAPSAPVSKTPRRLELVSTIPVELPGFGVMWSDGELTIWTKENGAKTHKSAAGFEHRMRFIDPAEEQASSEPKVEAPPEGPLAPLYEPEAGELVRVVAACEKQPGLRYLRRGDVVQVGDDGASRLVGSDAPDGPWLKFWVGEASVTNFVRVEPADALDRLAFARQAEARMQAFAARLKAGLEPSRGPHDWVPPDDYAVFPGRR